MLILDRKVANFQMKGPTTSCINLSLCVPKKQNWDQWIEDLGTF